MIYRPLIEGMTWSYSRIKCFEDCPYRWYMKYISDVNAAPRFYSSYGSYMHALLKSYYEGQISKDDLPSAFLRGFSENVKGERPGEKIVSDYVSQGASYLRSFRPFECETVAVEKSIHYFLQGRPFVGILDYIGRDKDGLVLIDHKSRALKPRTNRKKPTQNDKDIDDMLRQLYLYCDAVEQEYGEKPKKLCLNCFRSQTLIDEPYSEQAHEEAVKWATDWISSIEDENDFPPRLDFFPCRNICDVSHECCYFNPEANG